MPPPKPSAPSNSGRPRDESLAPFEPLPKRGQPVEPDKRSAKAQVSTFGAPTMMSWGKHLSPHLDALMHGALSSPHAHKAAMQASGFHSLGAASLKAMTGA